MFNAQDSVSGGSDVNLSFFAIVSFSALFTSTNFMELEPLIPPIKVSEISQMRLSEFDPPVNYSQSRGLTPCPAVSPLDACCITD